MTPLIASAQFNTKRTFVIVTLQLFEKLWYFSPLNYTTTPKCMFFLRYLLCTDLSLCINWCVWSRRYTLGTDGPLAGPRSYMCGRERARFLKVNREREREKDTKCDFFLHLREKPSSLHCCKIDLDVLYFFYEICGSVSFRNWIKF